MGALAVEILSVATAPAHSRHLLPTLKAVLLTPLVSSATLACSTPAPTPDIEAQAAIYYKTLPNGSDACLVLFWDVLENDGLDMNHALLTADFCNDEASWGGYFLDHDSDTPIKEQLELMRAQLAVLKESEGFQDWFALIKEHQAAE